MRVRILFVNSESIQNPHFDTDFAAAAFPHAGRN
jgi:hypothetical protein